MPVIEIKLYQYTVVNRIVTSVDGLQTLLVNDANGDGLMSQTELATYFSVSGRGHMWGAQGTDSNRLATFTVGSDGARRDFDLYTTGVYEVGDAFDTSTLVQNFRPFNPETSGVPCFDSSTMIETNRGAIAACDLAVGDLVMTRDAGLQPIRWIGSTTLSAGMLAVQPKLKPIRIRKGALGNGLPEADLVVSPQHRILVRSKISQRMFGADEVLVAAKQLCQLDNIEVEADATEVTYVHFLFNDHQIVYANGAEAESLLVGPESLKTVGNAARDEILTLFPEFARRSSDPARMLIAGRAARSMAARHAGNGKMLLS